MNPCCFKEDVDMMTLDFSPLYRSAIGFERLADLLDNAMSADVGGFPPYNIETTGDNRYRITMAVAGFTEDDLSIVQQENELVVTGVGKKEAEQHEYLYHGIAGRPFERRFQLADYVKVADAQMEHGLLQINLIRELPEALRPRKIEIGKGSAPQLEKKVA
jgi:molecular chaperone IbpA